MQKEPALISGVIGSAVAAIIAVGVAFGAHVTEAQSHAILGAIAPVVILIMLTVTAIRSKVYSPAAVAAIRGRHVADGPADL